MLTRFQTQPQLSEAKKQLLRRYLSGKQGACRTIPRRATDATVPLSFNQEQVWTHTRWIGAKPAYNELITITRRGLLDVQSLELAFDELNRRHEIWRTTFDMGKSAPIQIVHKAAAPVKLRVFDLRKLSKTARLKESQLLARANASAPFDLTRLPLWRATVVRVADDEFEIQMNLHHMVSDGVTVYRILLPELRALYGAYSQGQPSPLAAPGGQYGDFAFWQRSHLTPEMLEPHLAWWTSNLAGSLPVSKWPDKQRGPVQKYHGATEVLCFAADVVNALRAFAESESATLFMVLAAGFYALLHRYTGETDSILGIAASSRTPETEGVMGYFINLLPGRVDLTGKPGFGEVVRRVRKTVVDALEHGVVPYAQIVKAVQPRQDLSRNPIFQIMISQQPAMHEGDSGWDMTQASVSSGSTKMDLYLNLETRPDGMRVTAIYNPDLLDAETVRSMFGDWQALLLAGAGDPERSVLELPAKPERARRFLRWLKR